MNRYGLLSVLVAILSISSLAKSQGRAVYDPFGSRINRQETLHVLRKFVHHYGSRRMNQILVARVDPGDGESSLYGYWREGNSILLLTHFTPTFEAGKETTDYGWLEHKARIDLHKDVVPTVQDVGWSTYLVDKAWADRIVKACVKGNRRVVIYRSKSSPRN